MADFNALRERLAGLNRKSSKGEGTWKPKDVHNVRLVTYPYADDSFLELSFHYDIGDAPPVLCPAQFGKECPICVFAEKLKQWKDPSGNDKPELERKQDWEIFKKIQAKARVYVPMVERGKESEGVKFWGMTTAQAQQALDVCTDADRLAELGLDKSDAKNMLRVLFDEQKGYDLEVTFAKPGEKGNTKTFTQITLKGRIKSSPLASTPAEIKKIKDSIKKIKDVFPELSVEEVSRTFAKFVGGGSKEAPTEGGTEKYGAGKEQSKPAAPAAEAPKPTNSGESAKLTGTKSIDEAFGDLVK